MKRDKRCAERAARLLAACLALTLFGGGAVSREGNAAVGLVNGAAAEGTSARESQNAPAVSPSQKISLVELPDAENAYQYTFTPELNVPLAEVLSAVGLEVIPAAVSLRGEGDDPLISLTGDQPANWTLKALKAGNDATVLSLTVGKATYQILLSVEEVNQETSEVFYIDADGNAQTWKEGFASASAGTWRSGNGYTGWYVVNQNITVPQRINVVGDVKLILGDDCTLNAEGGIQVSAGNSLTIYAQTQGSGTLKAASREANGTQIATGAAIGGALMENGTGNAGSIHIHGGNITATAGAANCAGIGGGTNGSAVVEISGGRTEATGNGTGMGIGGAGEGTRVTIRGGDVVAKAGSEDGKGIAGLYGAEIIFQEGKMTKGSDSPEEKTETDGVIYAPDGTVYTGVKLTTGTGPQAAVTDTDTNVSTAPSTDYIVVSSGPSSAYTSGSSNVITLSTGVSDTAVPSGVIISDSGMEMTGYNVVLATFSPDHGDEIRAWADYAIDYRNHMAGKLPPQPDADILTRGLDGVSAETLESLWNAPGAPETADELISAYGYVEGLKGEKASLGPGQQALDTETEASVQDALQWIEDNQTLLNLTGNPFFLSIHVDSEPVDAGDARDAETDESISALIAGLDEAGELERTVVICTVEEQDAEETVPLIIFHPDWPEGAVVEAETSHLDVLPTILEMNEFTGESRQNVLNALPGRNLLSLVEEEQAEGE